MVAVPVIPPEFRSIAEDPQLTNPAVSSVDRLALLRCERTMLILEAKIGIREQEVAQHEFGAPLNRVLCICAVTDLLLVLHPLRIRLVLAEVFLLAASSFEVDEPVVEQGFELRAHVSLKQPYRDAVQ